MPSPAGGTPRAQSAGVAAPTATRVASDLQSVLAHAVARLAADTGCTRVVFWERDASGTTRVRAAHHQGGSLAPPAAEKEAGLNLP